MTARCQSWERPSKFWARRLEASFSLVTRKQGRKRGGQVHVRDRVQVRGRAMGTHVRAERCVQT